MKDLGPTLGTVSSRATAISDTGQGVGWMGSGFFIDGEAYIWEDGVVTPLGPIAGGFFSIANAINNSGKVAGSGLVAADGFNQTRGFLWEDGRMIDLPPLPGLLRSGAADVNDLRQVVGVSWSSVDNPSATAGFIWQNGVMTNLNDLIPPGAGVHINGASAINNAGQIAGTAGTPEATMAVLLTPVNVRVGDLDGDCRVRVPDLLTLLAAWGRCSRRSGCGGDLNNDGTVNQLDLVLLIENWG